MTEINESKTKKKLIKLINEFVENNNSFTTKDTIDYVSKFSKNIHLYSLENKISQIVRTELSKQNYLGEIKRISWGFYEKDGNNLESNFSNNYKEELKKIFGNNWSYANRTLEREIGINIQLSNQNLKYIYVPYKNPKSAKEISNFFLEKYNIKLIFLKNKINNIQTYAISEIISEQEFNDIADLNKIYDYLTREIKVEIFDLLLFRISTKFSSEKWINDSINEKYDSTFRNNFKKLSYIWSKDIK